VACIANTVHSQAATMQAELPGNVTRHWIQLLFYVVAVYYKRWKWAPVKSRRIIVDVVH
jgi:hypothetical protein